MRLKELREERNLTQWDVANGIQTSQRNIGRWEKGEVLPSSEFIVKLADFFQVSADYLLGRSDDLGVVTIQSGASELTPEEKELVRRFRPLARPLKDLIFSMLDTWEQQAAAENGSKKHA